jgi:glyoxylase-like metal-dependent hydrolase (beta-lactamase superfamily II)
VPNWTDPGAFEVAPKVYRIPLPLPNDGLRAVNVYAIPHDEGITLVDSGWALLASRELLVVALGELGYTLHDVSDFLVTHAHRDHYTQAVVLRREFGTKIAIGQGERESLELLSDPQRNFFGRRDTRLAHAGADDLLRRLAEANADNEAERKDWELPDEYIDDRAVIGVGDRTLQAIHTPGHTRGHLVFHDATNKLLFAGDHVLPSITPSVGLEAASWRSPLSDYLTSLHLMKTVPDARLLPAHGVTTDSVHERVDQLLEHHARRLDLSLQAVDSGAHTAYEVAQRLGWTRINRRFGELDLYNQVLAVVETAAHLDVLVETGRISKTEVDGTVHYLM